MFEIQSNEHIIKNLVVELNDILKKYKKSINLKNDFSLAQFIQLYPCKNSPDKGTGSCDGFHLDFSHAGISPVLFDCACIYLKKRYIKSKNPIHIQMLEKFWPLKRGMVDTQVLAWQVNFSAYETGQSAIALAIKCAAMFNLQQNKKEYKKQKFPKELQCDSGVFAHFNFLLAYESVFLNKNFRIVYWSHIKLIYHSYVKNSLEYENSREAFLKNEVPQKKLIILSLEDAVFRLRSGSNVELSAFEQFINDLSANDNSLVVFSTQILLKKKHNSFYQTQNYSISYKKAFDDNPLSLEQVLEPETHIAKDSSRFIEPFKHGTFDRLVELLGKGQEELDKIEKDYGEWKAKFGS